jgi:multiple sugar transport system permease protein
MVPSAVTFVPTFAVVAQLRWINTLQGIIVPGLFNVFSVFIFRQFFLDFPKDLEEAGKLDGLGAWGTFLRIVLPNSKGSVVALGSIAFINSWNAFLWPLIVGQSEATWTVQVTLSTYLNSYKINLPALFAGSLISVVPLLILFFVFQRQIVQGVKMSGVKG